MAAVVTNICASSCVLTWPLLTCRETGKWSLDSTFIGAIAALVMIKPSAGFVDIGTAFFFGVAWPGICRLELRIKFSKLAKRLRWVDNGDTFATHCVGGFVGAVATGLFARRDVAAYNGITEILGESFFDGELGSDWGSGA